MEPTPVVMSRRSPTPPDWSPSPGSSEAQWVRKERDSPSHRRVSWSPSVDRQQAQQRQTDPTEWGRRERPPSGGRGGKGGRQGKGGRR